MRRDHLARSLGPADLQRDHRDSAGCRHRRRPESLGLANRLEEQADHAKVESRPSAYSTYSPTLVTISCPEETIRLNPMPRSLNAIAANADPEWLMKATGRDEARQAWEADRAQADLEVDEAHPVPAAERHGVLVRDRCQPRRQGGPCGSAPSSNRLANVVALPSPPPTQRLRAPPRFEHSPRRGSPGPRARAPRRCPRSNEVRRPRRSAPD